MNQQKNQISKLESEHQKLVSVPRSGFDIEIYDERSETPRDTIDLIARIEKQIETLQELHLRKKFLIKEITNLRSR